MDGDELPRMAEVASREGYGLAMHAVGNLAVDRALDAFEHAERVGTAPPRIEHGLLVSRDQLARTADAGVAIVTQPLFLEQPGMRKVPRRASFSALPLRTALAEGVLLAGSSDAPVSDFDVFRGMEMAVERRMPDGSVHDPHERIDRRQALQLYTTHAAAVCGVEDRGHLGEGARADFVVLDADPLSTRNVLTHIDVLETWLGGEQVWTRTLQPAR
jgi:predicted amidohydrolase YtcJ